MSGAAWAQDTNEGADDTVEELVVTAPNYVPTTTVGSKVATSILETPQSITVITRDQIELLDWNSLQQVVRYTAGVNGELYGTDTRADWLRLRGFNPVQYIDGLQAGIGSAGNNGTDLYGFESVEILKGPSSGLYGLSPPGGIVNLTSRRPRDVLEGEVGVRYASFETYEGKGTIAGPLSDSISGRVTGLYRDNSVPHAEDENDKRLFLSSALKFGSGQTTVTPLVFYQWDKLTNNGGGFLPAYGTLLPSPQGKIPRNRNLAEPAYNFFKRDQSGIGYEFHHEFNDDLMFEQNLKYQWTDVEARYVYGGGLIDPAGRIVRRNNYQLNETVRQFAVDNRGLVRFDTGSLDHTVIGGLDYRHFKYSSMGGFAAGPNLDVFTPVYGSPVTPLVLSQWENTMVKQTGIYAQDQVRTGDLVVTVGARQDWVTTENRLANTSFDTSKLSYRIGANYVTDVGLAPYISYSKSFQPLIGRSFDGEVFKPTEGSQVEAGVKYQPRAAPGGAKILVTAAVYRLVQSNLLTADPAHIGFSLQFGEVELKGIELEGVARINERLSINGSYSRTDAEITKATNGTQGKDFPLIPRHKASLFVDYTFQEGALAGFGAGFGARYTSAVYGDALNNPIFRTSGLTLFDAVAHYNIGDWRVSLSANNLFDKKYVATCSSFAACYYGVPRQISLGVTRSF